MTIREFKFDIGDKVYLDGDDRMTFVVIGLHAYARGEEYLLSWLNEGNANTSAFDAFRLTRANG